MAWSYSWTQNSKLFWVRGDVDLHCCPGNIHQHVNKWPPPIHHHHHPYQPVLVHYRTQASPKCYHFLSSANENVWEVPTSHNRIIKADDDNDCDGGSSSMLTGCVHKLCIPSIKYTTHYRFYPSVWEFQIMFQIMYRTALFDWLSSSAKIHYTEMQKSEHQLYLLEDPLELKHFLECRLPCIWSQT